MFPFAVQPVGGTAFLEGADDLQVVELQHHIRVGGARDCIAGQGRGTQYAPGDAVGRRRHIGKAQHVR